MEAYTAFAKVYDRFMDNVPYDKWGDFIHKIIQKFGISKPVRNSEDALESERNLVLDLGCGTGILTEIMYQKGYDMIGVDISGEMLEIASGRENHDNILYICQDMCELDLYSTIGTVYCSCDSVNYLIEDEELEACFKGVENYLYPEGLFIFDFNTIHKYRDIIGETTIAQDEDECSFIWDNYFDAESNINEYDLTLFIKESESIGDGSEGLYSKYRETHYQRGFKTEEICDFIKKSGLLLMAIIDENEIENNNLLSNIEEKTGLGQFYDGTNKETQRAIVIAKCINFNK